MTSHNEKAFPVNHFVQICREMLGTKENQVALNRSTDRYYIFFRCLSIGIPMTPFQHTTLVKANFVEGLRLAISAKINFNF